MEFRKNAANKRILNKFYYALHCKYDYVIHYKIIRNSILQKLKAIARHRAEQQVDQLIAL